MWWHGRGRATLALPVALTLCLATAAVAQRVFSDGFGVEPFLGSGRAETNLMKIMNDVTYLNPQLGRRVVVVFDDPLLFTCPITYMTEPASGP